MSRVSLRAFAVALCAVHPAVLITLAIAANGNGWLEGLDLVLVPIAGAIPAAIAGVGVWQGRNWGRKLAIITASACVLLSLPLLHLARQGKIERQAEYDRTWRAFDRFGRPTIEPLYRFATAVIGSQVLIIGFLLSPVVVAQFDRERISRGGGGAVQQRNEPDEVHADGRGPSRVNPVLGGS
jgi:hypothetical protein